MKQKMIFFCCLVFMTMMILFPNICITGAKNGLRLWYESVLPTLLPYMILTNVLFSTGILSFHEGNSRRFFSIHSLFAIFIGFFCGYPMGAYYVTKNYQAGYIGKAACMWLLSFVNLSSPAFIIQFIVIKNLNGQYLIPMLASVYGSALITAILLLPYYYKKHIVENEVANIPRQEEPRDVSACISDACLQAIRLCGYIVIFSIIVNMVTAHISTVTIKHIFLIGLLEITNGINTVCGADISEEIVPLLIAAFTSFGSISCIFQTISVCRDSKIPMHMYVASKLFQAVISTVIMLLFTGSFK